MMTLLTSRSSIHAIDTVASEYDSHFVSLVVHDGLNCSARFCASDVWGYVSPTGTEYAIVNSYAHVHIINMNTWKHVFTHRMGKGTVWGDCKTYGHWAYAVKDGDGEVRGITTFDLSRVEAGIVEVVDESHSTVDSLHTSHNIAVDETSGFLYQLGIYIGEYAFVVYSVLSGPPVEVARYPHSFRYVHDAQVITYADGPYDGRQIMFACTGNEATLWIVDVTDKQNMVELATVTYPNARYSHQVWLDEARDYAYLNDEAYVQSNSDVVGTTTFIFDVRDLTNVRHVGTFSNGVFATNHNNFVHRNKLYMANYASGMRIFDINDRIDPREVAYFDTHPPSDLVCVDGRCGSSEFTGAFGIYPFLPSRNILITDTKRGLFVLRERECTNASLNLEHIVRIFRQYIRQDRTTYCDDTNQNRFIDLVEVVNQFRAYLAT